MGTQKQHERTNELAELVRLHRTGGESLDSIAAKLGIDRKTLQKHYGPELDEVAAEAKQLSDDRKVALARMTLDAYERLVQAGNVNAAVVIFGLKALCGWRETAPATDGRINVDDMSDEQLAAIVAERARARRRESSGNSAKAPRGKKVAAGVRGVHA